MRRSARNGLLLLGCLIVIGGAGGLAVTLLSGASAASAQSFTTSVKVVQNDAGGIAKLATITPLRLSTTKVVPAGTTVTTTNATLAGVLAPAPSPAVGATLTCQLSVNWTTASQVVDIVRCQPAA